MPVINIANRAAIWLRWLRASSEPASLYSISTCVVQQAAECAKKGNRRDLALIDHRLASLSQKIEENKEQTDQA